MTKSMLDKYWVGGSIGLFIGIVSCPALIISKLFGITNQEILVIMIFGFPILGALVGMLIDFLIKRGKR